MKEWLSLRAFLWCLTLCSCGRLSFPAFIGVVVDDVNEDDDNEVDNNSSLKVCPFEEIDCDSSSFCVVVSDDSCI